jgi:hypothetical protein
MKLRAVCGFASSSRHRSALAGKWADFELSMLETRDCRRLRIMQMSAEILDWNRHRVTLPKLDTSAIKSCTYASQQYPKRNHLTPEE